LNRPCSPRGETGLICVDRVRENVQLCARNHAHTGSKSDNSISSFLVLDDYRPIIVDAGVVQFTDTAGDVLPDRTAHPQNLFREGVHVVLLVNE